MFRPFHCNVYLVIAETCSRCMHNVQYVMSTLVIKTIQLTHTAWIESLYTSRRRWVEGGNIWFLKKNRESLSLQCRLYTCPCLLGVRL